MVGIGKEIPSPKKQLHTESAATLVQDGRVHYNTAPKFGGIIEVLLVLDKKGAKLKVMDFQSVVSAQRCYRHLPLADSESLRRL